MGRTMIAGLMLMGSLTGCNATDWREGEETIEACVKRFAPKEGAVDLLADDPGGWVPSFTYDITKLDPAIMTELIKTAEDGSKPGTVGVALIGSGSSRAARDKFADTPATDAGVVLIADDPLLYKVRGKPGLYRDLIRQGCEDQRAGMRLISHQFTREDQLVGGELERTGPTAAEMRTLKQQFAQPKIEDLLP